ncbi:MAG: FtsW/RodA/SpoVE family cell cycle protein [Oscillospiraceae bacterium]
MKKIFSGLLDYLKKTDSILLTLCIVSTVYGIVLISSATRYSGLDRYVTVQAESLLIGLILYFIFSVIDLDILADKWKLLFVFSILFIGSLFIFGTAGDTGNRAWIRFAGIGIQPAEVVKIPFTILLAKQIIYLKGQRGLNHIFSLVQLVIYLGLMFGIIIVASSDLGTALVYLFIFIVVLFVAGLKLRWFALGIAAAALVTPYVWNYFLTDKQRQRILAPYDSSIDPSGLGITWQSNQSKIALASGQFSGQGLYDGAQTQSGSIPQQHTDFIFAVAGEELGLIGCAVIIVLLMLIIIRCIYVGIKSGDSLGLYVCTGIAAMLIFQTFENIGMCLGLTPVIGLTLPFFSSGGSSIITLFAAMGIVSGVKMRPRPSRFYRS